MLLACLALAQGAVFAHERVVIGDYVFVLGWLDEPPVVGLKNSAWIQITRESDGSAVTDAEATLTAQIRAGDRSKDLLLRPSPDDPGVYLGDFIPTRRGTYALIINGAIGDQTIEINSEIEEVFPADVLEFPEAPAPVAELQQSIDALRGEVNSARTFGVAALALAAIGLVLAAIGLGRKR
jgi:hypothetical protein